MLGPILITASVAFNATNRSYFPPRGFSLQLVGAAFGPQWMQPLVFSLELATLTALISAAAGAAAGIRLPALPVPRPAIVRRDHSGAADPAHAGHRDRAAAVPVADRPRA